MCLTFIAYYLCRTNNNQLKVLIIASGVFYGFSNPSLLLLLVSSAVINALCAYNVAYGKEYKRRFIATLGVVINLTTLAFFKYSPLISNSFLKTDEGIGYFLVQIPLPIGISFFTFQGISLVVDVYSGKYYNGGNKVPESFKEFLLKSSMFLMFFPQLIAGPIVKAHEFMPQIKFRTIKDINWELAFQFLVTGYFFKMVVADNLNQFTFYIDYPYFQYQSSIKLIVMLLGYSCQIFADFAGYSLIAIGLAQLFCYRFNRNFLFPYVSTSFSEFWRRWHISLSSYLREYLYIPLGGNRKGNIRTYINLFLTMVLGGLWHGAAWSYAVWGLIHGIALALERLFSDIFGKKPLFDNVFWKIIKIFFVFFIVTIAWLLFKLPNFDYVLLYIDSIFTNMGSLTGARSIPYILVYCTPVVLYHIGYLMYKGSTPKYSFCLYGFMLFMIFVNSGSSTEFIYFQF